MLFSISSCIVSKYCRYCHIVFASHFLCPRWTPARQAGSRTQKNKNKAVHTSNRAIFRCSTSSAQLIVVVQCPDHNQASVVRHGVCDRRAFPFLVGVRQRCAPGNTQRQAAQCSAGSFFFFPSPFGHLKAHTFSQVFLWAPMSHHRMCAHIPAQTYSMSVRGILAVSRPEVCCEHEVHESLRR